MVATMRCAAMLGALALLAQPAAAIYGPGLGGVGGGVGNFGGFSGPGSFSACPMRGAAMRRLAGCASKTDALAHRCQCPA